MKISYYWAKFFKKIQGKAISNSLIHQSSKVEAGSAVINSVMDKHSFCGYYCEISNAEIGSFCSIANHVIIGGGMHPIEWVSTSPVFYKGSDSVKAKFSEFERESPKRTIIGNDVWIGECAIIKQGVTIGHGAIIGMGSVVTKDVKPYSIVVGCPAKEIRKRFDSTVIERMLHLKWWNMSEVKLKNAAKLVKSPEAFLKFNEK